MKKQLAAVLAWFRENIIEQHLTFASMLAFVVSVTGLATRGGIAFLTLNLLSGLWLIARVYLAEFLALTGKNTERLLTAVLTPEDVKGIIREIDGPMLKPKRHEE